MRYCMDAEHVMEIGKMSNHRLLERFFYEARRNAFLVSFFYFIGSIAGLGVLTMLDPELGLIILVLGCVWTVGLAAVFLFLIHRIHQPLAEIMKITNEFFAGVMRDEELESAGAGPEVEKQSMSQQLKEMRKEISILREKEQTPAVVLPQYPSIDWFWPILILEWLSVVVLVCGILFMIPDLQNLPIIVFAVFLIIGSAVIALMKAHNTGRLKWLTRPKWLGGDE